MNKALTFLICVLLSLPAFAEAFKDGDFSFTTNDDGTTCTVTGTTLTSGSLEIPSTATYNGKTLTVTAIGDDAFMNKSGLSGKLIIPGSITYIGKYAFAACAKLTGNLELPERLASIGSFAFDGCSGFTGNLIIPEAITSIGHKAFENCSGLDGTLYFNAINCEDFNSLPHFRGTKFKNIVIGDNVNRIPANFLYNVNWGYESINGNLTIGKSVKTIGKLAFSGCSGLIGNLTLPESITTIDKNAFNGCSGFSGNLIIPRNVSFIGGDAFSNCSGLNGTLYFNAEHCEDFDYMPRFENTNLKNVVIGDEVLRVPSSFLDNGIFGTGSGYESITGTLTIGNSVVSIGEDAFCGCSGFSGDLIIPNSVITIGRGAFRNCSGFNGKLIIGTGLISIEGNLFENCSGFNGDLLIPNNIKSIGDFAFKGCTSLDGSLYFNAECCEDFDGSSRFSDTNFTKVVIGDEVKRIPSNFLLLYGYGKNRHGMTISIGNSVKTIGESAFKSCSSFTGDLIIPNSVTSIEDYAFYDCSGFNGKLILGSAVSYIGKYAFSGCTSLSGNLIIPGLLSNINHGSFSGCNTLNGILSIPAAVQTLDTYPFSDTEFRIVKSYNSTPPVYLSSDMSYGVFTIENYKATLYVPDESVEAYKASDVWKGFYQILPLSEIETLPKSIALSSTSIELTIGESSSLAATIMPEDATDKSIFWTTSDESIVTVDATGKITGVGVGEAIITAFSVNGLSTTCTVTVLPRDIECSGISLNLESAEIEEGASMQLAAVVTPDNATDKSVTWSSSDASIATVDNNGKVAGVKEGSATITASTANGLTATCKVTVKAKVVESSGISLNLESAEVEEGASVQLAAVVTPDNATDKSLTWSSSDALIATVDNNGKVTGIKAGSATITATTANGLTATCNVTVKAKVVESSGISLNLESAEVEEGSSVLLIATITPDDVTDKSVRWSSSDASIATVDNDGKVTGIKAGSATITATTANGLTATCKVTVNAKADSAIDNVAADGISVTTEGGEIVITAPEGVVAEVFAITGAKVRSTTDRRISGLAPGIYIVRIAGKVFKVRI